MSFLNNFFNAQKEELPASWIVLDNEAQLDKIIQDSFVKPVILFKHSITCGISNGAKYELESNWNISEEEADFYYLDLLSFRSVSNKIAELTQVIHQSPQVIVLKNGEAVFNTSHHRISVEGLKTAINNF